MKVLHIIPAYYPAIQFGGPTISVHELNKALVRKGVRVTVCTTNCGLENEGQRKSFSEIVDGVKVWYLRYSKILNFLNPTGYQFSPDLKRWLRRNIQSYDLVHITAVWNYPTLAGASVARKAGKPYILSPRGALYPYTFKKKFLKKWAYFQFFVKKILKNAALIHYTTEDEKEQCHHFLGLKNRAVVVPNGLDFKKFANLPSQEEFLKKFPQLKGKKIVLYLGRINWKKGIDLLMRAFSTLAKQRTDIHLVLVGEDDGDGYMAKMQGLARALGIASKVTFTGILTGKDKLAAYKTAEVFVLPSYSENFGMVVVEAMACKCPVIISNRVGIYREVRDAKAGVVIAPKVSEIVSSITLLLENRKMREEIRNNGYVLVKSKYDIAEVADEMIKVYKTLVIV